MSIRFEKGSEAGKGLMKWHNGLEDRRRGWAELRRCKDEKGVVITNEYQCLPQYVSESKEEIFIKAEQWGQVVGLLSHVREHVDGNVAEQMAKGGDKPVVSRLRFERLSRVDRERLYRPMVQLIKQLDGRVDIYDLANSVYYWGDEVKKKWVFSYYGNLPKSV